MDNPSDGCRRQLPLHKGASKSGSLGETGVLEIKGAIKTKGAKMKEEGALERKDACSPGKNQKKSAKRVFNKI